MTQDKPALEEFDLRVHRLLQKYRNDPYRVALDLAVPPVVVYASIDKLLWYDPSERELIFAVSDLRAREMEEKKRAEEKTITRLIRHINAGKSTDYGWMMPLSNRAKRVLLFAKIGSLHNLARVVREQNMLSLRKEPNFGPKTASEVKDFIAETERCAKVIAEVEAA